MLVICCHLVSSQHPKALSGFMNFSTQASSSAQPMDHWLHLNICGCIRMYFIHQHPLWPPQVRQNQRTDQCAPSLNDNPSLYCCSQRGPSVQVVLGMRTRTVVPSSASLTWGCNGSFCTTAQPICLKKNPLVHARTSPRQEKGSLIRIKIPLSTYYAAEQSPRPVRLCSIPVIKNGGFY